MIDCTQIEREYNVVGVDSRLKVLYDRYSGQDRGIHGFHYIPIALHMEHYSSSKEDNLINLS